MNFLRRKSSESLWIFLQNTLTSGNLWGFLRNSGKKSMKISAKIADLNFGEMSANFSKQSKLIHRTFANRANNFKFWIWSGAKVGIPSGAVHECVCCCLFCVCCRSWRSRTNTCCKLSVYYYLVAKIFVDTTENGTSKVAHSLVASCYLFVILGYRFSAVFSQVWWFAPRIAEEQGRMSTAKVEPCSANISSLGQQWLRWVRCLIFCV